VMRQRLADAHIGLEIMRLTALRTLAGTENGTLGREAMIGKLYWGTFHRELGELAMDVLAADATVCGEELDPAVYDPGDLQRLFLFSRSDTIYGGSNQIQRNIIGERALGLPKEPQP
jgi:alkylation response protein AidB-like acyl-CoA dehydrogenase